jgi:hypothetical protein
VGDRASTRNCAHRDGHDARGAHETHDGRGSIFPFDK